MEEAYGVVLHSRRLAIQGRAKEVGMNVLAILEGSGVLHSPRISSSGRKASHLAEYRAEHVSGVRPELQADLLAKRHQVQGFSKGKSRQQEMHADDAFDDGSELQEYHETDEV
eukprot:s1820_g13.t1